MNALYTYGYEAVGAFSTPINDTEKRECYKPPIFSDCQQYKLVSFNISDDIHDIKKSSQVVLKVIYFSCIRNKLIRLFSVIHIRKSTKLSNIQSWFIVSWWCFWQFFIIAQQNTSEEDEFASLSFMLSCKSLFFSPPTRDISGEKEIMNHPSFVQV